MKPFIMRSIAKRRITANWIISIELVGVASIIGAAFIYQRRWYAQNAGVVFTLYAGRPSRRRMALWRLLYIGGPSIVVVVGRVIFISERPKVDPFTAV